MFGFKEFALLNESFVLLKNFKLLLHTYLKGKGLEMVLWHSVFELLFIKDLNTAESPAIPGLGTYAKSEFVENAA